MADPELVLGGAPIAGGGCLPNILVIFSRKPFEIKEILVCRGGTCRVHPPKSATVVCFYKRGILYIIISHVSDDDRMFTWHFHEPACVIVTHLDFISFSKHRK